MGEMRSPVGESDRTRANMNIAIGTPTSKSQHQVSDSSLSYIAATVNVTVAAVNME